MQSTAFLFRCFIGPWLLSDRRVNPESKCGASGEVRLIFMGKTAIKSLESKTEGEKRGNATL